MRSLLFPLALFALTTCSAFADEPTAQELRDGDVRINTWGEYEILAFLGKPPVNILSLILDISSFDVWAYDESCRTCPQQAKLALGEEKAASEDEKIRLEFGTSDNDKSATLEGVVFSDDLLLVPDVHPMKETRQHKFVGITALEGADVSVDVYGQKRDGRIGLGRRKDSPTSTVDAFFGTLDKLLCVGNINGLINWMSLGKQALEKKVVYETIVQIPVSDDEKSGKWVIEAKGYTYGKYTGFGGYRLQLSTTTSHIGLEPSLYSQVNRLLVARDDRKGNLLVACSRRQNAPTLELEVQGKKFTVEPSAYIVDGPSPNECYLKFRDTGKRKYLVLGTPFLDSLSFCLDYDRDQVHFLNVTKRRTNRDL